MIFNILTILFQFQKVITSFPVSILKAVMESGSVGGFDHVRKKTEVISKGKKSILMNPYPAVAIKVSKDPAILPE